MKNKRNTILLLVGLSILGLLLLFILQYRSKPPVNWEESYAEDSRQPYGSFLLYRLLEEQAAELHIIDSSLVDSLPLAPPLSSTYFFIGESIYLDSLAQQHLLRFVEQGHTAFIISKTLPGELMTYGIDTGICFSHYWDGFAYTWQEEVRMGLLRPASTSRLTDSTFDFHSRFGYAHYNWHYFDSSYFCDAPSSLTPCGVMETSDLSEPSTLGINFARASYGKGQLYFHTNPLAFSNFHLQRPHGLQYAEQVMAHLPKGPLYWDRHSRTSEAIGLARNRRAGFGGQTLPRQSPFQYILSQPALAAAWYIVLALGLFYLLFRAKRRQRIIPVLPGNRNTSLEFIRSIGTLYFLQRNHRKLALQKMQLLLSFIRHRYQLDTGQLDEAFAKKLAQVSEAPPQLIRQIITQHENIQLSTDTSEETLISFHQQMERFYAHCK